MQAPTPADPWLSILVPVYNVAPYLRGFLHGLAAQLDDGVEVLLREDGSTDGSAALAAELAAADPAHLRLLPAPHNQGVSAARNALLEAARGRWCWFLDADDELSDGVLPRLRALLHAADAPDLVFVDYRVLREREKLKHRLRGERHRPGFAGPAGVRVEGGLELLEGQLVTGNVFCWTVVARRALWVDGPRFPEGQVFEDMATMPRLVMRACSGVAVGEPWVAYRRRDDSLSATLSAAKIADLTAALRGLRTELLQRWPDAPGSVRFAVMHQAARNLVAAMRHADRLPAGQGAPLRRRCREDFLAAAGEDLPLLWRQYRRRGWWARIWALRAALR